MIASYLLLLFFLWYGVAEFVPMFATSMWKKIAAVVALLFVVLSLLKM